MSTDHSTPGGSASRDERSTASEDVPEDAAGAAVPPVESANGTPAQDDATAIFDTEAQTEERSAEDSRPTERYPDFATSGYAGVGASEPEGKRRRSPVFGTIFWGVALLVFAVVMAALAVPTITVDPVALTIGACIFLGALLVAAGIAASARNRQR